MFKRVVLTAPVSLDRSDLPRSPVFRCFKRRQTSAKALKAFRELLICMVRKLPRNGISRRWSLRIYRRWSEKKKKKKKKWEREQERGKSLVAWLDTALGSFSKPKSVTPFFSRLLASWLIWAVWYLTELTQAVLLALWRAARVVYVQAVQILFPDKLARRSLRNSRRKVLTALPPLPRSCAVFPPPFLSVPFSRRYFKLLDVGIDR